MKVSNSFKEKLDECLKGRDVKLNFKSFNGDTYSLAEISKTKMFKRYVLKISIQIDLPDIFRIGFIKGYDFQPRDFNHDKFEEIVNLYLDVLEGKKNLSELNNLS